MVHLIPINRGIWCTFNTSPARISLNPEFTVDADRAKLAGELVQGLSASYAPIYYQAIGILPIQNHTDDIKPKFV